MTIFETIQLQINDFLGSLIHLGSSGSSQLGLALGLF